MQVEYKKTSSDNKSYYSFNFKKALVLTLLFFNILIYISPNLDVKREDLPGGQIQIHVEEIPITHQVRRTPPPPKPTVPIPSDNENIPEDVTIEETTLQFSTIFDEIPEGAPIAGTKLSPPRPLAWVFPEYPEEEKKKGVRGIVKLSIHINNKGRVVEAQVLDNTTGSEKCAQAAVEAALGSRFTPAKEGKKAVSYWITQPYRFDLKK
ncbi:MAG: energy transducer TonB [bacterium]